MASDFARPEFQLAVQNNTVVHNELTIVITPGEAQEIETKAEACRARVREMMSKYRPAALGNRNGGQAKTVDVAAEAIKPEPAIEKKAGQEKSPADATRERVERMYTQYQAGQAPPPATRVATFSGFGNHWVGQP